MPACMCVYRFHLLCSKEKKSRCSCDYLLSIGNSLYFPVFICACWHKELFYIEVVDTYITDVLSASELVWLSSILPRI